MTPVFEPQITEEDVAAVVDALRRGEISGNFGSYIARFEEAFASYIGCKYAVATSSGTTALQLAVAASGCGAGKGVIVSSLTNVATALAAVHNGAIPVPCDSEADTWNMDVRHLEALIDDNVSVIIPVHFLGHAVDMRKVMEIADRRGLVVVEDCAEAHGAELAGQRVGSFGHMGCFSFYANKIITTGEGGMITTNDESLAAELRLLRNLAFKEPRFVHDRAGYNFRMTGFQAALGLSQLGRIAGIIERKRAIAARYNANLRDVRWIRVPTEKEWAKHVYWMYGITIEGHPERTRDTLRAHLQRVGIETRTFFCPMNEQPFLLKMKGFRAIQCPIAGSLWRNGLYLPSSLRLSDSDIDRISECVREHFSEKERK